MAKWPFVPQRQASGAKYRPASLGFGCTSVSKSGELSVGNAQNVPVPVMPVGALIPFAGTAAPAGWLLCNGGTVSRTTYAQLFSVIGTTYGSGDGKTTFNLPDLRGRVPVGVNGSADPLGKREGEKTHTLTVGEMPKHQHESKIKNPNYGKEGLAQWEMYLSLDAWSQKTDTAAETKGYSYFDTTKVGSGTAHNNMQPSVYLNYIIKA